jgi:hypothetical protein
MRDQEPPEVTWLDPELDEGAAADFRPLEPEPEVPEVELEVPEPDPDPEVAVPLPELPEVLP